MKNIIKIVVLSIIIVSLVTACSTDNTPENEENPCLGNTFTVSNEQVWEIRGGTKLSAAYFKSSVTADPVTAYVIDMSKAPPLNPLGSGDISNGILNFTVPPLVSEDLMDWSFFRTLPGIGDLFELWSDLTISDPNTKVNILLVMFSDNGTPWVLNNEKLIGTRISFGLRFIDYFYVDRDCRITGNYGEKIIMDSYGYTESSLDLSLKEGWNMVCEKQTLDFSGKIAFSMELVNPKDFRWVMLEP